MDITKKLIPLCVLVTALVSTEVFAGGAVAANQQKQLQQQQIMQQQMLLQRQAVIEQQKRQQQQLQPSQEPAEEVSMQELLKSFETSSQAWNLIMDPEVKVYVVAKYIQLYYQKNVLIKKSPVEYAQLIEGMAHDSPAMLNNPFERVLMMMAIIEYDFDNGQDKDHMAMQILGKEGFLANKKRLGLK